MKLHQEQHSFRGKDYRPAGGFLNYLQNSSSFPFPQHALHQPPMSQNFYYIGGTSHYTPSLALHPVAANGSPSPSLSKACSPRSQSFVHIDSGDDDGEGRTGKRLIWTQEEDASRIYASGQYDDQLMDKAHRIYGEDYGGQFLHMGTWKAVRDQPKWHAYNKKLNAGEAGDHTSSPTNIEDIQRLIGTKAAKADRNDKGKPKAKTVEVEELDKYLNLQAETNKNRSEAMELQKRISAEKLEAARLAHLAAKENKEAKMIDKEAKMIDKEAKMVDKE